MYMILGADMRLLVTHVSVGVIPETNHGAKDLLAHHAVVVSFRTRHLHLLWLGRFFFLLRILEGCKMKIFFRIWDESESYKCLFTLTSAVDGKSLRS